MLAGRTVLRQRYEMRRLDGVVLPVELSAGPTRHLGKPAVRLELRDLSAQVAAESALLESEHRYRRLFEQAPVGIFDAGLDGVIAEANPELTRLLGTTRDQMVGRTTAAVSRPTESVEQAADLARLVSGETDGYLAVRTFHDSSGRAVPVEVSVGVLRDAMGRRERLLGVVVDRSEQERAEHETGLALAELARERDSSRALLAALTHGYAFTVDGVIQEVNDAFCRLVGYPREQLVGLRAPYPFWLPGQEALYAEVVRELRASDGEAEMPWRRADGTDIIAAVSTQTVLDSSGQATGRITLAHDVTSRSEQTRALGQSQQLLAQAQRQALLGSWSLDLATGAQQWSEQMFVLVGMEPDSLAPSVREFLRWVHPADRERYERHFAAGLRAGGGHTLEHRVVRPDGSVRHVLGTAEVTLDPDTGRPVSVSGSAQDVTELRQREADLAAGLAQLAAVAAASRAVLSDPAPRQAICGAARDVTDALAVALLEVRGDRLAVTAADGSLEARLLDRDLSDADSLLVRVFRSGQPVLVSDVGAHALTDLPEATAAICLPVFAPREPGKHVGGQDTDGTDEPSVVGVLAVALTFVPERGTLQLLDVLEILAREAALAIDRSDLRERLQQQARTDGLTGLTNRRVWDEELPRELARAARAGTALTVVMLDLDNFKAYNDTHGHAGGDALLRAAAGAWSARLRETDLLARYGGEEFAAALAGCDLPAAISLVDALRGGIPAGCTASAGLAVWDGAEDSDALLARADAALYAAKSSGRDRTSVAPPAHGRDPAARLTRPGPGSLSR